MQTGVVLYGNKESGWTAMADGKKVSLPPEGGRILENGETRLPGPAEKKPRPRIDTAVFLFGITRAEQGGLVAPEWALQS